VAWWRNGTVSRTCDQEVARAPQRNDDSGQVVHTHVPRRRRFSLNCGAHFSGAADEVYAATRGSWSGVIKRGKHFERRGAGALNDLLVAVGRCSAVSAPDSSRQHAVSPTETQIKPINFIAAHTGTLLLDAGKWSRAR